MYFPSFFQIFLDVKIDDKWSLDRCVSNLTWHVSRRYRGDFLSISFLRWIRCVSQTALQVDFLPLVSRSCSSPLSRSRQHVFPVEPRSCGWSVWFGVPRRRGRILIWNTISQFSLSEQQQLQKGCREAAPSTYFHSNLLENFFVFPIWFV